MTSPRAQERAEAQRLLRSASHVPYDVDAGMQRHRQLVDAQSSLPDWAHEVPAAGKGGVAAMAILGTLGALLIAGVVVLSRPDRQPASPVARGVDSASGAPQVAGPTPIHVEPLLVPTVTSRESKSTESTTKVVESVEAPDVETLEPLGRPAPAMRTTTQAAARRETKRQLAAASNPRTTSPAVERFAVAHEAPSAALSTLDLSMVAADSASRTKGASAASDAQAAEAPDVEAEQPEVLIEMEQLRAAERLLKQQPQRTLALVRAGFERFRPGYLNQERRYLEVMALLQMGKVEDARLLGRLFLHDYPTGPYRRKVEQALAAH